ncbi:MAG: HXXEE domain-containing protein [Terriglobales bacterium]
MRFQKLQLLFPIAVTLHNVEEGIWFPGWWTRHARLVSVHPNPDVFRFALAGLAVAAFAITYLSARKGKESIWAYLMFGYIVAMLANVFIPHIPASVVLRSYTPGVVTAVLINLPVMSLLAIRAVRERWVSGRKAAVFAIAVPLAIAAIIPMLLLIG